MARRTVGPAAPPARAPAALRALGRAELLTALAVVALALWAYVPALRAGWIWDDDLYVTNNAYVQSWGGLWDIWFGFTRHASKGGALIVKTYQYYPVVFSSFWLDHKLYGLAPAGYHAQNVLLHVVNAALVLRLARRLAIPGAAFLAALFLLHPTMVESVAWVSERKNLLSGFFYLTAFLAYLRFDDERRARWWVASFLLFVCALLSKTVTATLPGALLLALVWRRGRLAGRDLLGVLPFVAAGAALGAFAVHLERYAVGADRPEFGQTAFERIILIAPRAFGFYALKALWPHPVAFVYPRFEPRAGDPLAYAWLAVELAVVALLYRGRATIGVGPLLLVLFSAGTLAPALGFVPVFPHRYSWVADHFAYLGSLGFFALVAAAGAWLVARLPRARAWAAGVATALVLVTCAALARDAARSYHDEETLWYDTLGKSPDAWIAMINLGVDYMTKQPGSPERTAAALELFQRAERYPLGQLFALTNQGIWYRRQRDFETAAAKLRQALALGQRGNAGTLLSDLRRFQVRTLLSAGRRDEAVLACIAGIREVADPRLVQLCDSLVPD
jgi:hypothetical protein